ncbi:hypothetical protein I4U23_004528 [Adineta vaga]|nr:hypothetical protein I4U23_004528 [Adineta vaga]
MTYRAEDNFHIFFINAAYHLIKPRDDRHKEWVLFRNGSLYFQNMLNNEETPLNELINIATKSLSNYIYAPGSPDSDAVVIGFKYESRTNYYIYTGTFDGIVLIHPAKQTKDDLTAISYGRYNIERDKQDPIVVAISNTKSIAEDHLKLKTNINSESTNTVDPRVSKNLYTDITRLKLLGKDNAPIRFILETSPFNDEDEDDNEVDNVQVGEVGNYTIIGQIFPTSDVYKEVSIRIELQLTRTYPIDPPTVRFLTSINHPNINENGIFDNELLKEKVQWTTVSSLVSIIQAIVDCLDHPNTK